MHTTFMWQPVAKGIPKIDKIEVFAGLIMHGKENAIKREELVLKCEENGLIDPDATDKDRAMRKILQKARREYVILNDGRGEGYYRPTSKELASLSRSNQRENNRAVEVFKSSKMAKALEEDYRRGRLEKVVSD